MITGLKVGVVIPAFNEAASLRRLLPLIPRDLCDLVVVVNDGSTDDTSESATRNILPPNKFPYIPPEADPDPGYPVAPGMGIP